MIRGERKPGIMHAVIFAGFLALLARKVQLIIIGYDQTFTYPGALGIAFTLGKDLVEVAVLIAVGYAFYRRLVQKPARLERNREALLILSLIAAIMITDLRADVFLFVPPGSARPIAPWTWGFVLNCAAAPPAARCPFVPRPLVSAAGRHCAARNRQRGRLRMAPSDRRESRRRSS